MGNSDKETGTVKERKHLFGSTEKSDFILNMDFDGAQKMCGAFCLASMAIVSALAIPAYFTQEVGLYTEGNYTHVLSENFIFYSAALMMLMGWLGMLVFRIACTKGLVKLSSNKLMSLGLGVIAVSLISGLCSVNITTSVFGLLGRHEGILSIAACFGLFAVAAAVSDRKWRQRVCDGVVILGALNAVVAFLQAIPATADLTHNFFTRLFLRIAMDPDESAGEYFYEGGINYLLGVYKDARAATGFMISPHALAVLMTVGYVLALSGSAFAESVKRKVLYSAAAVAMAAAACLTLTVTGVVGIAAGGATVFVMATVKFAKGSKGAAAAAIPLLLSAAVMIVIMMNGSERQDEAIIFTDGYIVRSTTMYGRMSGDMEEEIYSFLRHDGAFVTGEKWLGGMGPDNGFSYISTYQLSTDRFFNIFLDHSAQLGIPGAVLWGLFLLVTLIKGFKAFAGFIAGREDYAAAGACAALIAYLAQGWFNTTWATTEYIVYILIGVVWSVTILGPRSEEQDEDKQAA